jgi:hypothetical protein
MSKRKDYTHIFERIAAENHATVTDVRREMEIAIRAGFENPDPKVQAEWAKIPYKGEFPTPEEVMTYVVRRAKKGNATALLRRYLTW